LTITITTGGAHPFPQHNMIMDITEFSPYVYGPPDSFFVGVYDSSAGVPGVIDFFSIEMYDDYTSGIPTELYISPDLPVNLIEGSEVYAQLTTGVEVIAVVPATISTPSQAGDGAFNVFCTGSGTMNWSASVIDGGSWLSISGGSSNVGNGTVSIHYNGNIDAERVGHIQVTAATAVNSPVNVTVVQAGYIAIEALIWSPPTVPSGSAVAIQNALTANGINSIMTGDITNYNLPDYIYVFVCLGINPNNHVLEESDSESAQLISYLNAGGRLYLEGGDTWAFDSNIPLHDMFRIDGIADGNNDLNTVFGFSCIKDMIFTYVGDNSYIDQLAPVDTALIFHKNGHPNYSCGIAYDYLAGFYRTIGTSFQFGGLDDFSASDYSKADLMAGYLNFFDNGYQWTPPTPGRPDTLYVFNGYHNAAPLAWDAPYGYQPPTTVTDDHLNEFPFLTEAISKYCKEKDTPQQKLRIGKAIPKPPKPQQTLSYYNVYRSDSQGGPFILIASEISRQYFRDESVANGNTYYYVVTAVYDTGESEYSGEVAGTPMEGGYYTNAGWAFIPPILDGFVEPLEWKDAAVVNITAPWNETAPVSMLVMNNENQLYIAVDDSGNLSLDDGDLIAFLFDEDYNREWPPGLPSSEGSFRVANYSTGAISVFEDVGGWWPDNLLIDGLISPAPGVNHAISISAGHVQYEVAIDLNSSALDVGPGDVFGAAVGSIITGYVSGCWPQEIALDPDANFMSLPAVFSDLELAVLPPTPFIMVSDTAINVDVAEGDSAYKFLLIENGGTADLIWSIDVDSLPDWLTVVSSPGTLSPGLSDTVKLNFNSSGLAIGEYDADFTIISNDPAKPAVIIFAHLNIFSPQARHLDATLTISDNNENFQDLIFGTAPAATDSYDPAFDQLAPPLPPTGSFDARFRNLGEDYLDDFRALNSGIITWDILYQVSGGGDPITISWDNSELVEGNFHLKDGYGGTLIDVNMKTQNSCTVTNPAITQMQIVYSLTGICEKSIAQGWNLLGLPFEVPDNYYQSIFPPALSGTLYGFDGSYYQEDILRIGEGYWLRFSAANNISIEGFTIDTLTIDLMQGWNLICGVSCSVNIVDVLDPGSIIIPGTLYGFDGAYYATDIIESGNGYWLRANTAGQIALICFADAPQQLPKNVDNIFDLNRFASLQISDATNSGQTLYYQVKLDNAADRQSYSLPPVPPAGSFDARFSDNYKINETEEALINIQSSNYPVTISCFNVPAEKGYQYVIKEIVANEETVTHKLQEGGSFSITNSQVTSLKLSKQKIVPENFIVQQNYPNPFNPVTEIRYAIPQNDKVTIVIYNMLGKKVKTLLSQNMEAGYHTVTWDGTNEFGRHVGSGIYCYTATAGKFKAMKKMVLIK